MAGRPDHAVLVRRRIAALAGIAVAAIALIALWGDDEERRLDPDRIAAEAADPDDDPLAYDPDRNSIYEARAATGSSHVIYEKSPGGVLATAARVERFRERIEAAAGEHGVDPDTMEAMVLLESAGRPQVVAGDGAAGAAGLAQILPSTAIELLGMEVDLAKSRKLTRRIESKLAPPARLVRRRARIDERFDPAAALDGMATYLELAEEEFGREDLAIASYHMGIGNLSEVIRRFSGDETSEAGEIADELGLSYAELFFGSSPTEHEQAWDLLASFGDDSSTYLWRVLASREIMELWRDDRERLEQLAEAHASASSAEYVFHAEGDTPAAEDSVSVPDGAAYGYEIDPGLAELETVDRRTLATLVFIGSRVRALSGAEALRLAAAGGYTFDIRRRYESDEQAEAFQFVLDRLRALAIIDYSVRPDAIHVAVSDLAGEL